MMYSSRVIREALREGSKQGFELFREIRGTAWAEQVKQQPYATRLAKQVLNLADRAKSTPLPPITFEIFMDYAHRGTRERYDKLLTRRLHELAVLTLAAMLQGTDRWIQTIEERLWELGNLYVWELNSAINLDVSETVPNRASPRHTIGLLTAETAFQLAETLNLLEDKLDSFLVYRIKRELKERVFDPYHNNVYEWQMASMNWQSVCSASIGSAALYCVEDENELAILLGKVLTGLQSYIEGFNQDGASAEGMDYWTYGFSSYVFFAELLRERTAGRLSLLEDQERVRDIARFPHSIILSGGSVVNFSDCGEKSGMPRYMAARLSQRIGMSYESSEHFVLQLEEEKGELPRWAYLSRELIWPAAAAAEADNAAHTQGMVLFRDAQWLIDKRLTDDGKLIAFAAKGGHNDEPHNHNDLGHFILHVTGKNVMPDIGAPEYTRETFSEQRYESLAASSRGHAVPIVNGTLQSPGIERRAHVTCCSDDGERTLLKLQLEQAYDTHELQSLSRELDWHYTKLSLRIKDSFLFRSAPGTIKETLLFRDEPRLLGPGQLEVDAGVCMLEISYPESAAIHIAHETYTTRKGGQSSVYIVTLDIVNQDLSAEVEIGIRIHMA